MKWWKVTLVIFGALIITALGIDAADTIRGSEGTLLSQVISSKENACPAGMVEVSNVSSIKCVDIYESSPSSECPVRNPEQSIGTKQNLSSQTCQSISQKGVLPWRFITRDQAMQMCARSGKRLPTNEEWYALSLGMVQSEKNCNTTSRAVSETGAYEMCITGHAVVDLVGNVWEWVSDDVIQGTYKTMKLPASGYIAQVDSTGMTVFVQDTPNELFESDYFWSRADGVYGIIRGGYYDSGTDAGIYTAHADTPPTSASAGMGFRCVR